MEKGLITNFKMGWRFLSFVKGPNKLVFYIEPMIDKPDILYLPQNNLSYYDKDEMRELISSIEWNRNIILQDDDVDLICISPEELEFQEGTLEATEAGREFLAMDLFNPDKKVSKEQAHELWCILEKRFAESVEGNVQIHATSIIENSVFNKIVIPALLNNDKAVLNFIGND